MHQGSTSKVLAASVWIAKIVLAGMFLMAGIMKSTQPIETLHQSLVWTAAVPELLVRCIGVAELLGALGLILPSILRIRPSLTPLAALGLAIVQLLAAGFHLGRSEWSFIAFNAVMCVLAVFIWWGRTKKFPITARVS